MESKKYMVTANEVSREHQLMTENMRAGVYGTYLLRRKTRSQGGVWYPGPNRGFGLARKTDAFSIVRWEEGDQGGSDR